jgi:uncharacterized protein Usg
MGGEGMQYSETTRRLSRLRAEAHLVSGKFDLNVHYDRVEGSWFHIERFPLPVGWNRSTADILIDIPHGSPGYPNVAPQWFWTNWDLATSDGQPIGHFFKIGQHKVDQIYWSKGYGHFCVYVREWRPFNSPSLELGDNLLKYLQIVVKVFHERQKIA